MAIAKTADLDLISLQDIAANTVVVGSGVDLSGKEMGMVYARFGRRSASAAGAGVNIRIEASHKGSGDNSWYPLATFTSAFAACEGEAVSGTVNAGTNVVTVASTANLAAGDLVFISNGTPANSEWGRVKSIVTNTSITLEDNLVNAQTGSTLYDSAEIYAPVPIPKNVYRMRAVIDGASFTQAFSAQVKYSTVES